MLRQGWSWIRTERKEKRLEDWPQESTPRSASCESRVWPRQPEHVRPLFGRQLSGSRAEHSEKHQPGRCPVQRGSKARVRQQIRAGNSQQPALRSWAGAWESRPSWRSMRPCEDFRCPLKWSGLPSLWRTERAECHRWRRCCQEKAIEADQSFDPP